MSDADSFQPIAEKMRAAGLSGAAVRAFEGNYRALQRNETGLIGEGAIVAVPELPDVKSMPAVSPEAFQNLLRKTVVIKLNGGLGTGMGLEKAKSLLTVREGLTFLDLIAQQILHLREETGSGSVPRFLLMNSFSTSEDTLAFLEKYPALGGAHEVEMMQNKVPKLVTNDLTPLSWAADPELEWCPPGHGDIYASLAGSGWLERLLSEGILYAFVSNSDNLGATLNPALLGYFAESGAPFLMEVTARTEADKKGGHLARRRSDGRLILRESAQCPKADEEAFQDISKHRYFNTNNLWIRLDRLKETLDANDGMIPLPMIRNEKTADPRDPESPRVYQLETAMGAAIESFAGAGAIAVGRDRFAPVKTTGDLLIIRSDACRITPDHRLELVPERNGEPPVVNLDAQYYKLVDGLETMLREAIPSLRQCERLTVTGPVAFAPGVEVIGKWEINNTSSQEQVIEAGVYGS
ncbi:MAG TPA: UTP--glucose-1-phosphate uridylyltransferase [Verrucomicrobiales bacterium]|jgi:UDP-N-acetylglucosamine pyrophosphorylase|nr:UTP--glucose-1-phosphate uridylyltransferase [Verrucomicrobiales bacterium]